MSDKAKIRAWLFQLLSELETAFGAEGEKTESGDKVTITITFTR
jgi:hypothetical protein